MDFLDEAVITVKSGDGGSGCISFRREKFIPRGGPDGGDGGDGGNVIVQSTSRLNSLMDFRFRRNFKAKNGQPGRGKQQTGKNGADVTIHIPLGTLVYDEETGELLADLVNEDQTVVLLEGGRGGKGNKHFATSTNRAPRKAQPGIPGEQRKLRLSLKYLADIGLIGLPNAGKSTLLSALTDAHPKIADYPFTTLVPNLGVMALDEDKALTMADIPGLIEGASEGRGLGHDFLKHVERTRLLLHLIDITYLPEGKEDILEDFHVVFRELENYDPSLTGKEQIVIVNKMDLYSPKCRDKARVKTTLDDLHIESIFISALTGEGTEELKRALFRKFFDHGTDFKKGAAQAS